MKLEMTSTNRTIVAILAILALGIAFWVLAIGPKRDEAKKLGQEVERVEASVAQHRSEAEMGLEARENFSADYQQLVVLGKAVPGDDDSASLMVQLNRIGKEAQTEFRNFELNAGELTEAPPAPVPAPEAGAEGTTASAPISPTEAAAAAMPLGASVGTAGFGVMPYSLTFDGDFFKIADFIKGLDDLVDTQSRNIAIDGRLITVDGFVLSASKKRPFPALEATFSVATYVTPPSQGTTGGATPSAPAEATAVPASTSIGASP